MVERVGRPLPIGRVDGKTDVDRNHSASTGLYVESAGEFITAAGGRGQPLCGSSQPTHDPAWRPEAFCKPTASTIARPATDQHAKTLRPPDIATK